MCCCCVFFVVFFCCCCLFFCCLVCLFFVFWGGLFVCGFVFLVFFVFLGGFWGYDVVVFCCCFFRVRVCMRVDFKINTFVKVKNLYILRLLSTFWTSHCQHLFENFTFVNFSFQNFKLVYFKTFVKFTFVKIVTFIDIRKHFILTLCTLYLWTVWHCQLLDICQLDFQTFINWWTFVSV